jgi:hypothetical protein
MIPVYNSEKQQFDVFKQIRATKLKIRSWVVEAFDVTEVSCSVAYDNIIAQISWALETSSTY